MIFTSVTIPVVLDAVRNRSNSYFPQLPFSPLGSAANWRNSPRRYRSKSLNSFNTEKMYTTIDELWLRHHILTRGNFWRHITVLVQIFFQTAYCEFVIILIQSQFWIICSILIACCHWVPEILFAIIGSIRKEIKDRLILVSKIEPWRRWIISFSCVWRIPIYPLFRSSITGWIFCIKQDEDTIHMENLHWTGS